MPIMVIDGFDPKLSKFCRKLSLESLENEIQKCMGTLGFHASLESMEMYGKIKLVLPGWKSLKKVFFDMLVRKTKKFFQTLYNMWLQYVPVRRWMPADDLTEKTLLLFQQNFLY